MAKNTKRKSSKSTASEGNKSNRPSHFLCFPLTSENTVPKLFQSLEYFRNVSTEPPRLSTLRSLPQKAQRLDTSREQEPSQEQSAQLLPPDVESEDDDRLGNISKSKDESTSFADSLRVLPSITHRPAGTFHLTLGVMNLSDPGELQRASELLQSLNLRKILQDAEHAPPLGTQAARKWSNENIEGETKREQKAAEETMSLQSKAEQPIAPTSTGADIHNLKTLRQPISPPRSITATVRDASVVLPISLGPTPIYISLTGLGAFPSPNKARVIWAHPRAQLSPRTHSSTSIQRPSFSVSESRRLYNFALHLSHHFRLAGFIHETRPLVLHATIANMRYKIQAKSGRTTKGSGGNNGKKRWDDGVVDVTTLAHIWEEYDGDVRMAENEWLSEQGRDKDTGVPEQTHLEEDQDQRDTAKDKSGKQHDNSRKQDDPTKEFIWCQDIMIDRVAICKLGATLATDPAWGEWYPPIVEKLIFPSVQD